MGQKHSQPETGSKLNPNPLTSKKCFDGHYGDIKLIQDSTTGETVVLREIIANNKDDFESELASLNSRVPIRHPNVINIMRVDSETKSSYCTTYYKISIYIEHADQNLEKELKDRISTQTPFRESEILTIADDVLTALSDFQIKGISHGDIRPFNVFNMKGTYKLSDPSLSHQKGLHGLGLAILQDTPALLSPELISQVPKHDYDLENVKFDHFKSDSYSLGVTLLSLATLTKPEDLYDYKQGVIRKNILRERLSVAKQDYSDLTYSLIASMLDQDEGSRHSPIELSKTIRSYSHIFRSQSSTPSVGGSHQDYLTSHNFEYKREIESSYSKKSASPAFENTIFAHEIKTTTNYEDSDDLQAKIQAALSRTEHTIRNISPKKDSYESYTPPSYDIPGSYAYAQNIDPYNPSYTSPYVSYSGESLKRTTSTPYYDTVTPQPVYRNANIDMSGLSGYTPNAPLAVISENPEMI